MNRLLSLKEAAARIGNVSPAYLRRLAADRLRAPHNRLCPAKCSDPEHRRHTNSIHSKYPPFVRDECGRWTINEAALEAHMARRIRRLEPAVSLGHRMARLHHS